MTAKYIFSLLVLFLILLGFYFIRKIYLVRKKLREQLLTDVDENFEETTQNIVLSISKSNALYKSLIKQVHPDKFQEDKRVVATELSMKITQAKRNYKELLKLKEEVEHFQNN